MTEFNKIVGIGMSKTGTTTLEKCFRILEVLPHKGFDSRLKKLVEEGRDLDKVFKIAESYRSFQDNPWYSLYREMDVRFPGSKFILTVRKDSETHANSSWLHGVRQGVREGDPTKNYIREKIKLYESHNQNVVDYFRDRPQDLLIVCWEDGDRWEKLCSFLEIDIPSEPFPHMNKGLASIGSMSTLERLKNTHAYRTLRRLRQNLFSSN